MEILYFVDLHGVDSALQNILKEVSRTSPDLVVVGGDIADFGSEAGAASLLGKIASSGVPFYYVGGNCDPLSIAVNGAPGFEQQCLHGRVVEVEGLAIAGISGAMPTFARTPVEFDDEHVGRIASTIAKERRSRGYQHFILVSHCPPKDTQLDRTRIGIHVGSKSVRHLIEQEHPMVGLHGHIHEAAGVIRMGLSLLLNPGPASKGKYALVRVSDGQASATLQTAP